VIARGDAEEGRTPFLFPSEAFAGNQTIEEVTERFGSDFVFPFLFFPADDGRGRVG